MTTTNTTNKPFLIEKWRVYEAYKAVKSNQGAAGVDAQTMLVRLTHTPTRGSVCLRAGSEPAGDRRDALDAIA